VLFQPTITLFNGLETTRLDLAFGLQAFSCKICRFAVRARLAPENNDFRILDHFYLGENGYFFFFYFFLFVVLEIQHN